MIEPADHTIDEIKAHLDEHPEDAQAVLEAEQARGDDARVTLLNALQGADNGQPKPGGRKQEYDDRSAADRRGDQLRARFPDITTDEIELANRNVDEAAHRIAERSGRDFNEVRQMVQTTQH